MTGIRGSRSSIVGETDMEKYLLDYEYAMKGEAQGIGRVLLQEGDQA